MMSHYQWGSFRVAGEHAREPGQDRSNLSSCGEARGRKRAREALSSSSNSNCLKKPAATFSPADGAEAEDTSASRLTASADHTPCYEWFCPNESLLERRYRTDKRREELLHLLYQDDIGTGDIDDLVREWVSLVMERDKLVHEQVNKENCREYFRDLQQLLRGQPVLLGSGSEEEVNLREVLMDLERCVTEYCRKRDILISSPQKPLTCSNTFAKPLFFHAPPPAVATSLPAPSGTHHTRPPPSRPPPPPPSSKQHQLDHETGQFSITTGPSFAPSSSSSVAEEDDSSGSLFKDQDTAEIPISECIYVNPQQVPGSGDRDVHPLPPPPASAGRVMNGADSISNGNKFGVTLRPVLPPPRPALPSVDSTSSSLSAPPIPPPPTHISTPRQTGNASPKRGLDSWGVPLRPPPPLPTSSPPPLPPSSVILNGANTSSGQSRAAGKAVSGTVQFATVPGVFSKHNGCNGEGMANGNSTSRKNKQFGSEKCETAEPENAVSAPKEGRKNLLHEISSVNHTFLKPTNRPRSPGGTPVKMDEPSISGDSMLQRALMTKFRSLHSTPLPQSSRFQRQDCTNSMDFSNAWSDVNASLVFEDPDITGASTTSGFTSNEPSEMGGVVNGAEPSIVGTAAGWMKREKASHNSSSAV